MKAKNTAFRSFSESYNLEVIGLVIVAEPGSWLRRNTTSCVRSILWWPAFFIHTLRSELGDFMNIKQYYHATASVYLNISLFAVGLSIALFTVNLFLFQKEGIWYTAIPFMVFSCIYFIYHLVYKKRYESMPEEISLSGAGPLKEDYVMLAFMPAPTLRVLLFNQKGEVLGEINDCLASWYSWLIPSSLLSLVPYSYKLTDANNRTLATFKMNRLFSRDMTFYNERNEIIGSYREDWKRSLVRYKGVVHYGGVDRMHVDVSGFLQSFTISSCEGEWLVSYDKGWMPLEWTEVFKELNTPILHFTGAATEEDRICIYGLCARLFSNSKN
ncbi:MAG: hypothetical protein ACI35R_01635 [Bacillus sp. (in: firmicutes)]